MVAVSLYRVIVPVQDIEHATRFYSAILGAPGERVSTGRHYFDCNGIILACYDPLADGDGPGSSWVFHPSQNLYFAVPNLAAALEKVRSAGGDILDDIAERPWGERSFYARDPFGTPICCVDAATVFTGRS